MAAADRNRDLARSGARGQQRQRGHARKLCVPADRKPIGGGDRHPDSGKAAGPDSDQDGRGRSPVEQFVEHRHQPLAVAAANDFIPARQARAVPVEQGRSAGCTRCVECQDHG